MPLRRFSRELIAVDRAVRLANARHAYEQQNRGVIKDLQAAFGTSIDRYGSYYIRNKKLMLDDFMQSEVVQEAIYDLSIFREHNLHNELYV